MSDLIRLAGGVVSAYDLLNTPSYLVTNWTRQSDMGSADQWFATQPDSPMLQNFVPSLEVGAGGYYGKFASTIEFTSLTQDQRQYIDTNILAGKPVAQVTAYLEHPIEGFGVWVGELLTPYVANSQGGFSRYDQRYYNNNQYVFQRATRSAISYLLLENGEPLLLENGNNIILEQQ